jgi:hypothetical protein
VDAAWEGIFLLVILKIPLIYLCAVVWWAIRAEPTVEGGSGSSGAPVPLTPCGWDDWKRGRWDGRGGRPIHSTGRPNSWIPRLRAQQTRARVA